MPSGVAPLLGSSPPAKTASWPINKPRGGLSRSLTAHNAAARSAADGPACEQRRGASESSGAPGAQRAAAFSFSRTPFASHAASGSGACSSAMGSSSRPPVANAARPSLRVEGFSAPTESGSSSSSTAAAAAGAALSPGKLATRSSLLTASLLEPAMQRSLSAELFGSAQPSTAFQGLVVLPDRSNSSQDASPVDMAPLVELQALHPVFNSSNVVAAYAFAARAHADQTRKSGESVLSHLLATACILAELGMPEEVVAAGLLHDVLCDTQTTRTQLAAVLPACVVDLVARVSQLNQLSQNYRDNTHTLEAEAMLDMLTGMDDVSALLIKLADRLHNMRTIGALSRCKQVRMASETLDVFAVLANRLGAWAIKAELEDLSFKALNPEEYQLVQQAVAARTAAAAAASSGGAGLAAGIDELTRALQAAGLEVVDVSGRVKNVYGVWKKIQKHLGAACGSRSDDRSSRARTCRGASDDSGEQQHAAAQPQPAAAAGSSPRLSPAAAAAAAGSSFGSSKERATAIRAAITHIHDVQALRVVVPHKHDCYAAMRVVQDLWTAMPGRVKDYIRQRKANGYQSLHLTVRDGHEQPLEIQIRTPKMHYIAEYGFAAHWRYKERLGRQDLWLDRLVQWKKWVASEKLGIVDHKLRPSGSPGGSGGDAALADLAQRLQLERAASGGGSTGVAMEAALTAAAAAVAAPSSSAVDPMAAELAAVLRARGLHPPQQWRSASEAPVVSSSPADEKFAARFRMKPISEAELEQHGASVMVTGPRGVTIAQLPARCTVGQLLSSSELTEQLRRAGSSGGGGQVLSLSAPATTRLAVNGVVVAPDQADRVVLRSGDQVQLLEQPPHGMLGLVSSSSGGDPAAAGLLPVVMSEAGGSLNLFAPGQGEHLERVLQHKLQVPQRMHAAAAAAGAPALVS